MAGTPLLTPALVLGSVNYGETSRVVRLATFDHGLISAIAKGALRPKSRFGASLRLLSEGHAHLLLSPSRDLHLLTAFDLVSPHTPLAQDINSFLIASVMAEMVVKFVPPGPNPPLYQLLVDGLQVLESAEKESLPLVGLRFLWQLIEESGLAPSVEWCAKDGTPIPAGSSAAFSLEEGGLLCENCAATMKGSTRLAAEDVAALTMLLAKEGPLPQLAPLHLAAHRRLLARWVEYHLGEGELPALEMWRKWV